MSGTVLFDVPGPRTRARHRLYSLAMAQLLIGAAVGLVWYLGHKGEFAYDLWEPFVTPDYVRALLVDGLLKTVQMALTGVVLAVAFGVVFGMGKLSKHSWLRWPCTIVVEFFRAVPGLLLMVFVFLANVAGDANTRSYWSVVIALMLFHGAVFAEVFRAGILAVPKGQADAAAAIGLRKTGAIRSVVLPQALRIMLPTTVSQCVVVLKDTSLGMYVLAPGLTEIGKQIWSEFGNQLQTALVLAALYIAVNLVLTFVATWLQRQLVGERKQLEVPPVGLLDHVPRGRKQTRRAGSDRTRDFAGSGAWQ